MNHFFFQDQLRDNPEFLTELIAFNAARQTLGLDLPEPLKNDILSDSKLRAILSREGVLFSSESDSTSQYWSFTEDSQRLALLDSSALTYLGRLMSAGIYAEEIASVISREDVLRLKDFYSEPVYEWALMRGRYQLGEIRNMLKVAVGVSPITEKAPLMARLVLELIRSNWPKDLQVKSAATFQAIELPQCNPADFIGLPSPRKLWFVVKKILLRECDSQWTRYFK